MIASTFRSTPTQVCVPNWAGSVFCQLCGYIDRILFLVLLVFLGVVRVCVLSRNDIGRSALSLAYAAKRILYIQYTIVYLLVVSMQLMLNETISNTADRLYRNVNPLPIYPSNTIQCYACIVFARVFIAYMYNMCPNLCTNSDQFAVCDSFFFFFFPLSMVYCGNNFLLHFLATCGVPASVNRHLEGFVCVCVWPENNFLVTKKAGATR